MDEAMKLYKDGVRGLALRRLEQVNMDVRARLFACKLPCPALTWFGFPCTPTKVTRL
jgi:hypothetical protein